MGAFDFRAGKDVVKRSLNGSCVWKETSDEIEHSQDVSVFTNGIGSGTGL